MQFPLLKRIKTRLSQAAAARRPNFLFHSDASLANPGESGLDFGQIIDTGAALMLPDAILRRHLSVSGQMGCGRLLLVEHLLKQQTARGGGWLVIDPAYNNELREKLAEAARRAGRADSFHVLDFDHPDQSDTWSAISGSAANDVEILMQLLPHDTSPGADYYRGQVRHALSCVLGALEFAQKRVTLAALQQLLWSKLELTALASSIPANSALSGAYSAFLSALDGLGDTRMPNILGGIVGRIALLSQGKFGPVLNTSTPSIDFGRLLRDGEMLYVQLPVMGKSEQGLALGRMIVTAFKQAMQAQFESGQKPPAKQSFMWAADCLEAYAPAGVARMVEQCSWANVSLCWLHSGTPSNTVRRSEVMEILEANTWTKCFFRQREETASFAVQTLGMLHPSDIPKLPASAFQELPMGECVVASGEHHYHLGIRPPY